MVQCDVACVTDDVPRHELNGSAKVRLREVVCSSARD